MKEYTIIYTAEITEVIKGDETRPVIKNRFFDDKEQLAAWIEDKLDVDDVHIKGAVKVFEREL